jgi:hypothetical protein
VSRLDPVLAARFALGDVDALDLAGIAQDLLVKGLDSPSLRLLAGTLQEDLRHDGPDLLERSLRELGVRLPGHDTAVRTLVRDTARRMLAGELDPYDGAHAILGLRDRLSEDDHRLDFAYEVYSWEDPPPRQRRRIEDRILVGARDLLEDDS